MNDVIQAITQWKNREINDFILQRRIVEYPSWFALVLDPIIGDLVSASFIPTGTLYYTQDGLNRLFIFSEEQIFKDFSDYVNNPNFIVMNTIKLLRLTLEYVDEIIIDTYTDHAVRYIKSRFPTLKRIAKAIEVENALTDIQVGLDLFQEKANIIANYSFYLPVSEQIQTISWSDALLLDKNNGSTPLSVFTMQEMYQQNPSFVENEHFSSHSLGNPSFLQLEGYKLCQFILKNKIDTIIFNPFGPKTITLSADLCQKILESTLTNHC